MADLTQQIVDHGLDAVGRHYSVYRGVVSDIEDPLNMDRLLVFVPELDIQEWALPRGSHGSHVCGFRAHPLPKVQDIVYVTFEDGNPSLPLWEWHSWAEFQRPEEFDDPDVCGLITPKGTQILVNDRTGEVFIKAKQRMAIQAEGDDGIAIQAEKIYLNSSDQVIVNQGKYGVIDINELTEKLNQLVREVNVLRSTFNTHTHPGVQAGPGTTSPTVNLVAKPITQFNKKDYEDESFLH